MKLAIAIFFTVLFMQLPDPGSVVERLAYAPLIFGLAFLWSWAGMAKPGARS